MLHFQCDTCWAACGLLRALVRVRNLDSHGLRCPSRRFRFKIDWWTPGLCTKGDLGHFSWKWCYSEPAMQVCNIKWPKSVILWAKFGHFRVSLIGPSFWRAGTTPIKKKRSENLGWNFGVQPIPRVAPRVAPRIGFSHKLGRDCHSESCSENTPEFRELLREWPFHSESVFFKIGVVPRFLKVVFVQTLLVKNTIPSAQKIRTEIMFAEAF